VRRNNSFKIFKVISVSKDGLNDQWTFVTLKVYDLLGREVSTLVNEIKNAGRHKTKFDASKLPSGVYVYTLSAGNYSQTRKLVLMK
jgi:hypothetical protein